MKPGFTIIEILIATAIASIAGLMLTNAMSLMQRNRAYVDRYTDLFSRAALVHNQLTRDISGAFIPVQADLQTTTTIPAKSAQGKQKSIDKVFYSVNEGGQLSVLSCITNNPIQFYWGEKVGKPQPLVARVVYRLDRDKKRKDSYTLFRQQGNELDFAQYKDKKVRTYELIDKIKDFSVEYVAMIEKKQQATKTTEEQKTSPEMQIQVKKTETETKVERERKTFKEWQIDSKKQAEQKKQNQPVQPLIPHWMIIKISLWDNNYKHATQFEFVIPITTSLDRSLYPEQKAQPQQLNPKQRIIPPGPQVRNVRRVPGPHIRNKFMPKFQMPQLHTRRFQIVQGKSGPPQLRTAK